MIQNNKKTVIYRKQGEKIQGERYMNIATNFIGSDEVVQVLIKRKEELELMSAMVEKRID